MPLNNAGKNIAADAVKGVAVRLSLHSADPGANGANEVTGGSPAYARKSITWSANSPAGATSNANQIVFDVPAGNLTHAGLWNAAGDTFYGGQALSTPETFSSQGDYTVEIGDLDLVFP
jgi:hypothetical protein